MMDNHELRQLTAKLVKVRTSLLSSHPFFGRLLLRLPIGYANCGTAFTDMKKIVFDPEFARKISENELRFIFLHEVMHCVLHHCTRGRTLRPLLYNIACDIVVNSLIMDLLCLEEFKVDDNIAMHLVPDGREGRLFTAEEVYEMLLKTPENQIKEQYGESGFDNHIIWEGIIDSASDDEWNQYIREAAAKAAGSGSGIPYGLQRHLKDITHTPKTNWRQLLHDFIQHDKSDYSYQVPDKRFQGDIILPSFQDNIYGDKVEKLWFLIDTSGSISNHALSEAFHEIKDALDQIENLSGYLSFFDANVTEPVFFESVEEIDKIKPLGGGGTNFRVIFKYLEEYFHNCPPEAILILTDGYADFPDESAANDIPVMWLLIDSDIDAPWGESVHIES